MDDNEQNDVGAKLRRLVADDPLGPIDSAALLERGRRGKRRRKLVSIGGVAAGVAAVAVAASLLPNLGTAAPEVAETKAPQTPRTTSAPKAPGFSAVPGVPRGEAAVGTPLPAAETLRRCKLRYPKYDRQLRYNTDQWSAGDTVPYRLQRGDRDMLCTIPGGDKPSAELVAAARREPLPTSAEGQLRNCSIQLWVDLTRWKVMATAVAPGQAVTLVAMSPSGRHVVECELGPQLADQVTATPFGSGTGIFPVTDPPRKIENGFIRSGGQVGCGVGAGCVGWLYRDHGRIDPSVARLRIEPRHGGGQHDVQVRDGWFALAWVNGDKQARPDAKITAYDQRGKVLMTVTT